MNSHGFSNYIKWSFFAGIILAALILPAMRTLINEGDRLVVSKGFFTGWSINDFIILMFAAVGIVKSFYVMRKVRTRPVSESNTFLFGGAVFMVVLSLSAVGPYYDKGMYNHAGFILLISYVSYSLGCGFNLIHFILKKLRKS